MIVSADGETVYDPKTNLTWDRSGSKGRLTFYEAIAYSGFANSEKHLGLDGWRVPSIAELLSIVDFTEHRPAINSVVFPECECERYWSSTTYTPNPADAWNVSFNDGDTVAFSKTGSYFVRLVRSGGATCIKQS